MHLATSCSDMIGLLKQWKVRFDTELALQDDVAVVLREGGYEYKREHQFNKSDRIDFLVGRIGIECKIDFSANEVLRQLSRYATSSEVDELLLVTTKACHRRLDGQVIQGKMIRVYWISGL